jgi:biopolymer transport protein ExbB
MRKGLEFSLTSQHRPIMSREFFSMRQSWDLRPTGKVGGVWLFFLSVSVVCIALAWGQPATVQAQEAAQKGEAPAAAKDDGAEAAKPQAPQPAASTSDEGTKPPVAENMLQWAIRASGPIGLFLLCLSVYFTALVIRLFMEYRVSEAVPTPLVEKLEAAIRDKKFQDAYDVCKENDSFLARLVRVGIANLPNGRPEAKEAMLATSEEIVTGLEMKISYLATIGTLGPMIGLVGTVWGMIRSFQTIATAGGEQPRPEKVAEGISTALFITLEGITLSVPAIFFFAFFRNRISQMTMEANKVADRTISSLVAAAKTSKPA